MAVCVNLSKLLVFCLQVKWAFIEETKMERDSCELSSQHAPVE